MNPTSYKNRAGFDVPLTTDYRRLFIDHVPMDYYYAKNYWSVAVRFKEGINGAGDYPTKARRAKSQAWINYLTKELSKEAK